MNPVLLTSTILVALIPSSYANSLLGPTVVSNNWYQPGPVRQSPPQPPYNPHERSVQSSNLNSDSSFIPTDGVSASNFVQSPGNSGANYYYSSSSQAVPQIYNASGENSYQYLAYNPDEQSYSIYPTTGTIERQEFPPEDGGDGGSLFENFPSIGGVASGITGTASRIAQGIGLGSLGILGSIIVLALLGPLIVFAVLLPAAVLIIAILGFPVLQVTLPPSEPFLGRKLKMGFVEAARKAKQVLQSEECMERVSCAIARKARKLPYEEWILETFDAAKNTWLNRVSKSVKSGRSGNNCEQFKCVPVTHVVTKLKNMYTALGGSNLKLLDGKGKN